jgi:hypothetical protein
MANLDTILPSVIEHFAQQIAKTKPVGKKMHKWKRWTAEAMLEDEGSRDRLFDVYVDQNTPMERVTDGAKTVEYNVPINIDICYHETRYQTAIGLRDFDVIQRQITSSDSSALTGYQFPIWDSAEFVPNEEDSNYRTMRIPVLIRVITTV